jgi:hypothetical protein
MNTTSTSQVQTALMNAFALLNAVSEHFTEPVCTQLYPKSRVWELWMSPIYANKSIPRLVGYMGDDYRNIFFTWAAGIIQTNNLTSLVQGMTM